MKKIIEQIQFDQDKVIVQYESGQTIQFCKNCAHTGEHLLDFMQEFCADIPILEMGRTKAVRFERHLYFEIAYDLQWRVEKEIKLLIAFLKRRSNRLQKQRVKANNRVS